MTQPTPQQVARAYARWIDRYSGTVDPDPDLAAHSESQYPENVELISGTPDMDLDLQAYVLEVQAEDAAAAADTTLEARMDASPFEEHGSLEAAKRAQREAERRLRG